MCILGAHLICVMNGVHFFSRYLPSRGEVQSTTHRQKLLRGLLRFINYDSYKKKIICAIDDFHSFCTQQLSMLLDLSAFFLLSLFRYLIVWVSRSGEKWKLICCCCTRGYAMCFMLWKKLKIKIIKCLGLGRLKLPA